MVFNIKIIYKYINKFIKFVNSIPALKIYLYSIIALCYEGKMANSIMLSYSYYLSICIVQLLLKKHAKFFFGAYFRKNINKLTLQGFLCRELKNNYLPFLLGELELEEKKNKDIRKSIDPIKIIYTYIKKFISKSVKLILFNFMKYI